MSNKFWQPIISKNDKMFMVDKIIKYPSKTLKKKLKTKKFAKTISNCQLHLIFLWINNKFIKYKK